MKKNNFILLLILSIWFVISFVTNIIGPMLPMVISDFQLSLTLASFLPFSFFLAYGVMSIPAGIIIERYGGKVSLLIAFGFAFCGALFFVLFPTYGIVLSSLFIIGLGMAMLQVVILPLMREAGGERNYAFNAVLAQIVFGGASFVSPFVLTGLLHRNYPWSSMYLIFTVVFALMLIIIGSVKFPKVVLKENEKAGTLQNYKDLLKNKYVILYFLGIISYVGTEQGIANWMSQFLNIYHGISPEGMGATVVAWFWGLMTVGCLLGLIIVKLIDSKIMLRIFAIIAIINLCAALFAPASVAVIAFPCCGFSISIMFSIIFSLALNSVEKYHGAFSGILCTGIFGGALMPFLIGWIGDMVGLRFSMLILLITLAYILSISFWAKPLVKNKTIL
ncbi:MULTISPECIES: MFS transporter [unclassified Parabacteroides]|uniref:MFS transporter n=1 Tax=unclassified Parabacteroides TaxID=2649774 RepID=UPI002474F534|nr:MULTISPECIES: MFS transporter [unclassified Parabacteroides]